MSLRDLRLKAAVILLGMAFGHFGQVTVHASGPDDVGPPSHFVDTDDDEDIPVVEPPKVKLCRELLAARDLVMQVRNWHCEPISCVFKGIIAADEPLCQLQYRNRFHPAGQAAWRKPSITSWRSDRRGATLGTTFCRAGDYLDRERGVGA